MNKGNLSVVDNLVASIEIAHLSGGTVVENKPAAVRKWVTELRTVFADIHVSVEDLIIDGDKAVNRVTYRGTHTGELNDPVWGRVAPTGKQIVWRAIAINRFTGGKSVEAWDLIDDYGFWQQLGLIPMPLKAKP